jgi:hypothetical protein
MLGSLVIQCCGYVEDAFRDFESLPRLTHAPFRSVFRHNPPLATKQLPQKVQILLL